MESLKKKKNMIYTKSARKSDLVCVSLPGLKYIGSGRWDTTDPFMLCYIAMPLVENLEKYGVRHCTTTIWTKRRVHGAGDRRASHTTPANGRSAVIGDRERERGAGNWFD